MEATSREGTLPQSGNHYFRPCLLFLLQILFLCPGNDNFIFKNAQKATALIWLSSLLNTLPAGTLVERMEQEEPRLKVGGTCPPPAALLTLEATGAKAAWGASAVWMVLFSSSPPGCVTSGHSGREERRLWSEQSPTWTRVSMGKAREPPLRKSLTTDSCASSTKLGTKRKRSSNWKITRNIWKMESNLIQTNWKQ